MNFFSYLSCVFKHGEHSAGPAKRVVKKHAERTIHYTPHGVRSGTIIGRVVYQTRCVRCNVLISEM